MAPAKGLKIRRYSDDEMGYIEQTLDAPRDEVAAELGISLQSVSYVRRLVRQGWSRRGPQPWTLDELEVVLAPNLTVSQMVEKLPGRTQLAVTHKRAELGYRPATSVVPDLNPRQVRGRPLIAKTCIKCGRLLPAKWFRFDERKKLWETYCRAHSGGTSGSWDGAKDYSVKAQAMSLKFAENSGNEYSLADHEVLADPTLNALSKALRLRRTYQAVRAVTRANGYKSHVGLGDPERDLWQIDNPNAERLDEITAALQPAPAHAIAPLRPAPMWD